MSKKKQLLQQPRISDLQFINGMPVFPQMLEVLGYQGRARYVAIFWEEGGSELVYDDGIDIISGAINMNVWLKYVSSPVIRSCLFPYSDLFKRTTKHALVIDRIEDQAYVSGITTAQEVVQELAKTSKVTSFYVSQFPPDVLDRLSSDSAAPSDIQAILTIMKETADQRDQAEQVMDQWLTNFSYRH